MTELAILTTDVLTVQAAMLKPVDTLTSKPYIDPSFEENTHLNTFVFHKQWCHRNRPHFSLLP